MNLDEVRTRYSRLADAFAAKIDAVPADKWSAVSPCEGWTARDVVKHVAESPGMIFGRVDREFTPPPSPDDPGATFASTRKQIEEALGDSEVAGKEFDGVFGRTTFAQAIDDFINFDLVIHRWDLAKATGQEDTFDPEDVRRMEAATKNWGDMARSPGVFGPEVDVPAGADEQTKLLAFTGRKVPS